MWEVIYSNEVIHDTTQNEDEYFREWWEVRKLDIKFEADSKENAEWLASVLNYCEEHLWKKQE